MRQSIVAFMLLGTLVVGGFCVVASADAKPISAADWGDNSASQESEAPRESAPPEAADAGNADTAAVQQPPAPTTPPPSPSPEQAAQETAVAAPEQESADTAQPAESPAEVPQNAVAEQAAADAVLPESGALKARLRFDAITTDQLYEALRQMPDRQEINMGLSECISRAVVSNQEILVATYEPLKSDGEIMRAKGEFDPNVTASASYSHSENTPSSQTSSFLGSGSSGSGLGGLGGLSSLLGGGSGSSGSPILSTLMQLGTSLLGDSLSGLIPGMGGGSTVIEQDQQQFETTLYGKLQWGTGYELKLELTEEESTFNAFEPEWSGGLTFTLTQPLLKGRGRNANLARVRSAKLNRRSGEHQVEQQVMTSIADVIKAYWDLVGAIEQLQVQEESLANAERLLEINERRLELGTAAKIEVLQAKAGVATRLNEVVSARSQVMDAEDRLKQLLDMRDDDMLLPVRIVPVDRPNLAEEVALDEANSVALAIENRPEVAMAQLEIDGAEVERKRTATEMWPKADLSGSYYRGGRGDKTREVFRGVEYERDMTWSVSLDASVPITNRVARGDYHKALMSKRQAQQRLTQARQELMVNVRMAVRAVATSRILVESNRQTVALQEANVEAERRRLSLGMTTTYDVLKIQEDLATAQSQEVQAIIGFQKALADLRLAEGVILREHGIEFEPPEPEKPISFGRSIVPFTPKDN